MPVEFPPEDRFRSTAHRALVVALRGLYRDAGLPGVRQISDRIRRDDGFRDSVSHETISAVLSGRAIPKWLKIDGLVRQLVRMSTAPYDEASEVRRFHGLWLAAAEATTVPSVTGTPDDRLSAAGLQGAEASELRHIERDPPLDGAGTGSAITDPLRSHMRRFIGRQRELANLQQRMEACRRVAVVGPGGVGKTEFAVEFARRHSGNYTFIWWVAAERPSLARASLASLARQLQIGDRAALAQTVRAALEMLDTRPDRWLLVYDNASPDEETLSLVPAVGGHVLVTSRDMAWADQEGYSVVRLDPFDRQESVEYLRSSDPAINPIEAATLAGRLNDLPLALRHVAAVHAASGVSLAEYMTMFDQHVEELVNQGASLLTADQVHVSARVAFNALQSFSNVATSAAVQILALLGYLAPGGVPLRLLRNARHAKISGALRKALQDRMYMDEALGILERFGFVHVDSDWFIHIHRLVQGWARSELGAGLSDSARRHAHKILIAANPGHPDDARYWHLHSLIAPHVWRSDLVGRRGLTTRDARHVLLDQARYLFAFGDYRGSAEIAEEMLNVWSGPAERGFPGPDHQDTLHAHRHLANALRMLGEYSRSRRVTQDALARLEGMPQTPDGQSLTIRIALGLGVDHRLLGEFVEGYRCDVANYERAAAFLGDDDKQTLQALMNVAASHRVLGECAAALGIDKRIIDHLSPRSAPGDRELLWARSNLARDLYGLGRYVEALSLVRELLPVYRASLGPLHMHVLLCRRLEAICLRKVGRVDDAETVARRAYEEFVKQLGDDHEHTLACAMSLANILASAREPVDPGAIRDLVSETLGLYRRRFLRNHPLVLAAEVNAAMVAQAAGGLEDAVVAGRETLTNLKVRLGEQHPYTLCAANNLGNAHARAGDIEGALHLHIWCVERAGSLLDAAHPDRAAMIANLTRGATLPTVSVPEEARMQALTLLAERAPSAPPDRWVDTDIEPPPM